MKNLKTTSPAHINSRSMSKTMPGSNRMKKVALKFRCLAASGAFLFLLASSVQAAIIANGDFSANAASFTTFPGVFGLGSNPASAPDWSGGSGIGTTSSPGTCPWQPSNLGSVSNWTFMQGAGKLSQQLTLVPGHLYQVTVALAQSHFDDVNPGRAQAIVQVADGVSLVAAGRFYDTNALNGDAFQTFAFTFTAPSYANYYLEIYNQPTGDAPALEVSQVSMTDITYSSVVSNGDFSANATSFTNFFGYFGIFGGGNPDSAPNWSGGSGIGLASTNICPWRPSNLGGSVSSWAFMQGAGKLSQQLTLVPGQLYRVTLALAQSHFDDVNPGRAQALVQIGDGVSQATAGHFYDTNALNGDDFQAFSFTFTAPSYDNYYLEIYNQPTGDAPALEVSRVSVTPIATAADAALVHQWTFNDGTAKDLIGIADGTLHGTATISGGRLQLSGSSPDNNMQATLGAALGTSKTLVQCNS
jgi:hypothetical protein